LVLLIILLTGKQTDTCEKISSLVEVKKTVTFWNFRLTYPLNDSTTTSIARREMHSVEMLIHADLKGKVAAINYVVGVDNNNNNTNIYK